MLNPMGDFEATASGLQPITYTAKQRDIDPIAGVMALRRSLASRDAERLGAMGVADDAVVFHVGVPSLAIPADEESETPTPAVPIAPMRGDTITEADGTTWTVQAFDCQTLRTRWKIYVTGER